MVFEGPFIQCFKCRKIDHKARDCGGNGIPMGLEGRNNLDRPNHNTMANAMKVLVGASYDYVRNHMLASRGSTKRRVVPINSMVKSSNGLKSKFAPLLCPHDICNLHIPHGGFQCSPCQDSGVSPFTLEDGEVPIKVELLLKGAKGNVVESGRGHVLTKELECKAMEYKKDKKHTIYQKMEWTTTTRRTKKFRTRTSLM